MDALAGREGVVVTISSKGLSFFNLFLVGFVFELLAALTARGAPGRSGVGRPITRQIVAYLPANRPPIQLGLFVPVFAQTYVEPRNLGLSGFRSPVPSVVRRRSGLTV